MKEYGTEEKFSVNQRRFKLRIETVAIIHRLKSVK